jgi:hypothetical protein
VPATRQAGRSIDRPTFPQSPFNTPRLGAKKYSPPFMVTRP